MLISMPSSHLACGEQSDQGKNRAAIQALPFRILLVRLLARRSGDACKVGAQDARQSRIEGGNHLLDNAPSSSGKRGGSSRNPTNVHGAVGLTARHGFLQTALTALSHPQRPASSPSRVSQTFSKHSQKCTRLSAKAEVRFLT